MLKNKPNAGVSSTLTIIFILNNIFGYCTSQLYEGSECDLKDGSLGICKSFVLCRWAIQGLNQRVITYRDITRCSFEGANEIICCGDERPTPRPDTDNFPIGTGDDEIYFDDGKFAYLNNRLPASRSPARTTLLNHPINRTVENPVTPSHVSIKSTSNRPPMVISTTPRLTSVTTKTTRSSNQVTTQRATSPTQSIRSSSTPPPMVTSTPRITSKTTRLSNQVTTQRVTPQTSPTRSSITPLVTSVTTQPTKPSNHATTQRVISQALPTVSNRNKTSRSEMKPTVHSFWNEWAPSNNVDVEIFSGPTANPINTPTTSTQNTTNSQLVMAPWLRDILNEAIASNSISTTTQSSFQNILQLGGGLTDVDNDINGESNNDLSFSRQKTTRTPSRVTPMSTSPTVPNSRPPPRIGQRRSEIACENYTSLSSPFINLNILGGSPTSLGEFPHMAALGFPTQEFGGNEFDFNCGGSIITENYILTAAHCVTDRNLPTIVRSGRITLITNDEGEAGVTSTIAEIIPHPNYRPSRRYDDIALIRVSSPIPFSDWIRPACLRSNMSDIDPDVQLIVTGWGRTSVERAQRSNSLLKTNLTGVSLESCNSSLLGYNANDRSLRNGVNLGQICAYDPQAKQDSCEGDSGGPLQIYSPNGMSTIVGVTSFGISCGSALPSVYARVAFYLDWIESIVWPNR